tara:strand:+ start:1774 stop:1965 length:192 start_codon:yes stop_codon:yes gene_type:complete
VVKTNNGNNIRVVDISYDNIGDKDDYRLAIDCDYLDKDEAEESAINYAKNNRLIYDGFDSRYC